MSLGLALLCIPIFASESSDAIAAINEAIEQSRLDDHREALRDKQYDEIQCYVHVLNTETGAVNKLKLEEICIPGLSNSL